MPIETVKTEFYKTGDGKLFDTLVDAQKHEKELVRKAKNTTYWKVVHAPDLTEGRGHGAVTYVKAFGPERWTHKMLMKDWCYDRFGRLTELIQGVAPIESWTLREIDLPSFVAAEPGRLGDYPRKVVKVHLTGTRSGFSQEAPNDST